MPRDHTEAHSKKATVQDDVVILGEQLAAAVAEDDRLRPFTEGRNKLPADDAAPYEKRLDRIGGRIIALEDAIPHADARTLAGALIQARYAASCINGTIAADDDPNPDLLNAYRCLISIAAVLGRETGVRPDEYAGRFMLPESFYAAAHAPAVPFAIAAE